MRLLAPCRYPSWALRRHSFRCRAQSSISARSAGLPAVPFRTHNGKTSGALAHTFFHKPTSTWQYVVADSQTKDAVIIDSAFDFDSARNCLTTETADSLLGFVQQEGYKIIRILESHAHADHLTAAQYIKSALPNNPPVGIGENIREVQDRFRALYSIPKEELVSVFDMLYKDGDKFSIGNTDWEVLHLPGHTPDHVGYKCGDDFVFVGDSLFLPDVGSARADFPGGSVEQLYSSALRLLALPESTRIFSGHDYPGAGRSHSCSSTVAEQKAANKHLKAGTTPEEFGEMRRERDKSLTEPKLLHQSLQVNIRAGHLPSTKSAGKRFLQIPLTTSF